MLDGKNFKDALEYGVAASALKHTILATSTWYPEKKLRPWLVATLPDVYRDNVTIQSQIILPNIR